MPCQRSLVAIPLLHPSEQTLLQERIVGHPGYLPFLNRSNRTVLVEVIRSCIAPISEARLAGNLLQKAYGLGVPIPGGLLVKRKILSTKKGCLYFVRRLHHHEYSANVKPERQHVHVHLEARSSDQIRRLQHQESSSTLYLLCGCNAFHRVHEIVTVFDNA